MAATINHPSFTQPTDNNCKLWRYMDFTKFVSMISSKTIYLSRSDKFIDPFEGKFSKKNKETLSVRYKTKSILEYETLNNALNQINAIARESTYINCWHQNEYESAAMWNLYSKTNEAVAIETTYSKLVTQLPNDTFLGLVKYVDYESTIISENNLFSPFMFKRLSFEHEREVRIVKDGSIQKIENGKGKNQLVSTKNHNVGLSIKIDLNELIDTVHVSPTAPSWFYDLVCEICSKYGITSNVKKSDLYISPLY